MYIEINYDEVYNSLEPGKFIALVGINGSGKSYSINQIRYRYDLLKRSRLFDARLIDTVSHVSEKETIQRMLIRKFHYSHGQSMISYLLEFLEQTINEEVVFIDEPETALDLAVKIHLLEVINANKVHRPIVVASNCPFIYIKADIIYDVLDDKLVRFTKEQIAETKLILKRLLT